VDEPVNTPVEKLVDRLVWAADERLAAAVLILCMSPG
jgi:hypothetical protein